MFLNENIVVAYHFPCNDGYFAALGVQRQLGTGVDLKLAPLGHNTSMTEVVTQLDISTTNTILFVDFVPTPSQYEELKSLVQGYNVVFFALDHHDGNLERLREYSKGEVPFGYVFSNYTSGAGLVSMVDLEFTLDQLDEFYKGGGYSLVTSTDDGFTLQYVTNVNALMRYVAHPYDLSLPLSTVVIRDLWLGKEEADAFSIGFQVKYGLNPPAPNSLEAEELFFGDDWYYTYKELCELGKKQVELINSISADLVSTANIVHGNGFVFGVNILNNTPNGTASTFGNMMCDKLGENHQHNFAVGIYLVKSKRRFYDVKVELRSKGTINCVEVAKFISKDGGGHPNAAGAYFNGNVDSLITLLMQYSLV